jgi:hypothetical protein
MKVLLDGKLYARATSQETHKKVIMAASVFILLGFILMWLWISYSLVIWFGITVQISQISF